MPSKQSDSKRPAAVPARVRELTIIADIASPRARSAVLAEIGRAGLTAEMFTDKALAEVFATCIEDADGAFGITDGSIEKLSEGDRRSLPRLVKPATVARDVDAIVNEHRKQALKAELIAASDAAWDNQDPAAYLADIADQVRRIQATVDGSTRAANEDAHPRGTVADIRAKTRDKVDYSCEIFRDLWLERGGAAFWISSSGTGKSVHSIQAAYAWAIGKPYFGISPRSAIRIAIVQAEDSTNECTVTFNGVRAGYKSEVGGGWTEAELAAAEGRIVFWGDICGKRGSVFCSSLRAKLQDAKLAGAAVDLVIINPLTSYLDGDINNSEDVVAFLQNGLDPVLKSKDCGCAALIFHHTTKPPTAEKGKSGGWSSIAEKAEYAGAGSSALTNWARSTLLFLKKDKCDGHIFEFIASKRGHLLGWKTSDGKPTQSQLIRHTAFGELVEGQRTPFWQTATDEDVTKSIEAKKAEADKHTVAIQARAAEEREAERLADMTKLEEVAEFIRTSGKLYPTGVVRQRLACAIKQSEASARAKTMFIELRDNPAKYGLLHAKFGLSDMYGARAVVEDELQKMKI